MSIGKAHYKETCYKFSCSLDNTDMLDELWSMEAERFTLFYVQI